MLGKRPHHTFQSLADQHHFRAGTGQFFKPLHPVWLQIRLQLVLKVFITQQVEPVAAYASQDGMHDAGRKSSVCKIEKRPQGCPRRASTRSDRRSWSEIGAILYDPVRSRVTGKGLGLLS